MMELHHEFHLAARRVRVPHMQRLHAAGVPISTLCRLPPPYGAAPIVTDPAGTFQLHQTGRAAVICPVAAVDNRGWWGCIDDLVAFYVDAPEQWWTRLGSAPVLGLEAVADAQFTGRPLRLHATPLAWLRADGDGACIIDWRLDPRAEFSGIDVIEAPGPVAEQLRHRLDEVSRPRIEVVALAADAGWRAAA